MMNNKGLFNRLLSNNVALLILSLLISFVIWFFINANSQTESNVTIANIPITIDLSEEALEDGLQIFAGGDTTASIEVSGNRITVGSLSPSDIQVVALQTNSIIAPGSYNLDLSAKKVGVKTNYNFASNVSPSYVTVFVDKHKERTFTITDDIVYKVDEGYYANTSLSETTVTIAGPETVISSIDKVVVQGTLDGSDGNSKTESFELVYLDKDGNMIDITMSVADLNSVEATLTPLPILEVELDIELANSPKNYPSIGINPRKIKIAAEQSVLDTISDNIVIIGKLDFSELSNKSHIIAYDITLPNGCKNLSDSAQTNVSIDLSGYESKTIKVSNFNAANIDLTKYNVTFNSSGIEITVCGPRELVEKINSGNIITKVDFSSKLSDIDKKTVSLELPVTFELAKEYENCWIYGDYTVSVNVTKN